MLSVAFELVAPVYAGDRLIYIGTVAQVSPAVGALQVDVVARRGAETVLRGSYRCKVLAERPA